MSRWFCRLTAYRLCTYRLETKWLFLATGFALSITKGVEMALSKDWLAGGCTRERELMWLIQADGCGLVNQILKRRCSDMKFCEPWGFIKSGKLLDKRSKYCHLLDATKVFIADLIACSTCFGHHYAHHQELKSIIKWLLPVLTSCKPDT